MHKVNILFREKYYYVWYTDPKFTLESSMNDVTQFWVAFDTPLSRHNVISIIVS